MSIWESEQKKQARELRTTFSGKGMRGLKVLLRTGCILSSLDDNDDCVLHNDRIAMIRAMVGPKMDDLLDHLCKGILQFTKEVTQDA
jgi:hypothetical protein